MAYVITQNCCNDASCVAVCPVGCIHPTPDEPGFTTAEMLHIDPRACIDCGACADACPVDAIRPHTALTAADAPYVEVNADYFRDHPSPPAFRRVPPPVPLVTTDTPLRVAIVGSGPAGLYSAKELLRHPGVHIDLYERLPGVGGLINYGVAPDHPATKAVIDQFQFIGDKQRRLRIHLGVEIGRDLDPDDLRGDHHAVIYAHGAFHPRRLDIPGSALPGSIPAAAFVGWYNGHPDHKNLAPALTGQRAVVIGNGNVALDIARILLSDPGTLAHTTMAPNAVQALRGSTIDEVVLLGRRGPEHAAFTLPELLALAHRPGIDIDIDPHDIATAEDITIEPDARRKLATLSRLAAKPATPGRKRLVLRFHSTPVDIHGVQRVSGVRLSNGDDIDTEVVIHAIGFRGQPIRGVPFDPHTGTIPHTEGRVLTEEGIPLPGVYTTGWIKRGPSGVIGTNRTCAEDTVTALLADHAAGLLQATAGTTKSEPPAATKTPNGARGGRSVTLTAMRGVPRRLTQR
jgi:ferredoxin--NADP+ reductase